MEVKEIERAVIAKPVASRPSCSNFRTFTDLLTDSATVSNCHEIIDAPIRPKTLRLPQPAAAASVPCPRVIDSSNQQLSLSRYCYLLSESKSF